MVSIEAAAIDTYQRANLPLQNISLRPVAMNASDRRVQSWRCPEATSTVEPVLTSAVMPKIWPSDDPLPIPIPNVVEAPASGK